MLRNRQVDCRRLGYLALMLLAGLSGCQTLDGRRPAGQPNACLPTRMSACGSHARCAAFGGYHPTCWHPWPGGCAGHGGGCDGACGGTCGAAAESYSHQPAGGMSWGMPPGVGPTAYPPNRPTMQPYTMQPYTPQPYTPPTTAPAAPATQPPPTRRPPSNPGLSEPLFPSPDGLEWPTPLPEPTTPPPSAPAPPAAAPGAARTGHPGWSGPYRPLTTSRRLPPI